MTKNSFIMQTRLKAVFAKLSDKQAGALIKSIFDYADTGAVANFEDGMVGIVFEMVKQDMDYAAKKYAETCAKRAESGRLGGRPKANESKKSKCFSQKANESKQKHIDIDVDNDNDVDINKQQLLTAPKAADKPRELNALQKFAVEVINNFEPDVKTKDQRSIWYKRNCRCLSDIFRFCGKNIPLAIKTIDVCLERMQKAGYSCGYEAVCRNLPEYMSVARQKMEGTYANKAQ